jgi:glycosyltransferase involved in cell wall biosynthesis
MGKPLTILFDAERMKYPHTGLYYFCKELGNALLASAARHQADMQFLLPATASSVFPEGTAIKPIRFWHKLWQPNDASIDVWHTTSQDSAYFPFHRKKPIVLTIHDLNYYHDERKPLAKRKAWLQTLQRKVDASAALVFISDYTAKDVQAHIDLKGKPYRIIYNGCTISNTERIVDPAYQPTAPFIFSIGTIALKKNFHVLPALLLNNSYQLVIAGITQQPDYLKKIQQSAAALGVVDRLIFTGPVSDNDKQWYYAHCEAFVFPSLSEGFGLPLVEAMHFGKPVFISDATSLPEIGGDAAYIFKDFSPAQMQADFAAGMADFVTHHRSEEVKKRAALFSWEAAVAAYWDLYKSLL